MSFDGSPWEKRLLRRKHKEAEKEEEEEEEKTAGSQANCAEGSRGGAA